MKIGLFFGSFNPVHNGHMVIAGYMSEFTDLEQVWMVVSPHNPLKPPGSLLQDYHRFHLVELAIGNYNRKIKASKIEFGLPRPSYTVHTLAYLADKYPDDQFSLIMGSDTLETIPKWKNFQVILDNHDIYIYKRPGYEISPAPLSDRIHFTEAPLMELSSSFIRSSIRNQKDVRYMMPESVYHYIDEMNFYKK